MYKKTIVIAGMILMLLLISGCKNLHIKGNGYSSTVNDKDLPTSTSIQKLTKKSIRDRYKDVDNICLEDYKRIDNLGCLAFSYEKNKTKYYGFSLADKGDSLWNLSYLEDYVDDQGEAVMIAQFIGGYSDKEDEICHVTIGYINNLKIKQVILYYPESKVNIIELGEKQRGFLDVKINYKDSLLKIECKSSKGKIIYKKDFDKEDK